MTTDAEKRPTWMLQQQVENAQHRLGADMLHPAIDEDEANRLIMGRLQPFDGSRVR
jgi:hypothetical protein